MKRLNFTTGQACSTTDHTTDTAQEARMGTPLKTEHSFAHTAKIHLTAVQKTNPLEIPHKDAVGHPNAGQHK